MIEREKKRIKLTNKYATKRMTLLTEYNGTRDFNLKLETHAKIQKLQEIVLKFGFEIDVGKQDVLVAIIEILGYLDMFYEKWLTNVYYQVLQNQVGKNKKMKIINYILIIFIFLFLLNFKLITTTVLQICCYKKSKG